MKKIYVLYCSNCGSFMGVVTPAAKAYDQKIFSLSGKKEFLNFPEEF